MEAGQWMGGAGYPLHFLLLLPPLVIGFNKWQQQHNALIVTTILICLEMQVFVAIIY